MYCTENRSVAAHDTQLVDVDYMSMGTLHLYMGAKAAPLIVGLDPFTAARQQGVKTHAPKKQAKTHAISRRHSTKQSVTPDLSSRIKYPYEGPTGMPLSQLLPLPCTDRQNGTPGSFLKMSILRCMPCSGTEWSTQTKHRDHMLPYGYLSGAPHNWHSPPLSRAMALPKWVNMQIAHFLTPCR